MNKKKFVVIIILIIISFTILLLSQYKELNLDSINNTNNLIIGGEEITVTPVVYHALFETITTITPINSDSLALPDSLIILPGVYKYGINNYELKTEGLYRLILPGVENQQRIVFSNNTMSLLSSIAWIYAHGNVDNKKDFSELETIAKSRQIIGTCGNISNFILTILGSQNIEARVVSTLTLDEWNFYNNGHTMIEIYEKKIGKFILFDLDNNAYFFQNNIPLSFIEFIDAVKTNNYEIKRIAQDPYSAISAFKNKSSNFDYNFLQIQLVANDNLLNDWYKRVIQVPFIHENKIMYYFDEENKKRIESFSSKYQFIEYDEFMDRFYSMN